MYNEVIKNDCHLCVMLLPNCTETKVFKKYIDKVFNWEVLAGRVSFLDENNEVVNGNTSGTVVVYTWKEIIKPERKLNGIS